MMLRREGKARRGRRIKSRFWYSGDKGIKEKEKRLKRGCCSFVSLFISITE
jgi:hypothetical protein